MKAWSTALAAGALSLLSGCAHDYLYVPVGPGTAGGPAVRYPIPPAAPRGEAYVTSFGFTDIDADAGMSATMLHARLAVSNGSGGPWSVDGRLQGLTAPGRAPQGAAFLNSDAGQGPVYVIPPGQARVFDLYFAMTPPLDQALNVSGFSLDWNVDAGGQPVSGRTSFQRFEGSGASYDPYPPYVAIGLGYGVGWWYGPFFPYHRFHPPIIRRYYFPPARTPAGAWRGSPPGSPGMRGAPPTGGGWRGSPPSGSSPGGAWRGSPPASNSVRAAPAAAPRSSGAPRAGGFRGLGGRGRGR
jgi:hypothetical protein